MKVFSCLFLFAPEVHLKEIEKLYVDGMIVMYIWKRHIVKLQDEWQELIQYVSFTSLSGCRAPSDSYTRPY